jgi:hypothetical protein
VLWDYRAKYFVAGAFFERYVASFLPENLKTSLLERSNQSLARDAGKPSHA